MLGLVNYYEFMGFRQVFPMRARISDIIEKCSTVEKSNEVKELEKIIRHTYFKL